MSATFNVGDLVEDVQFHELHKIVERKRKSYLVQNVYGAGSYNGHETWEQKELKVPTPWRLKMFKVHLEDLLQSENPKIKKDLVKQDLEKVNLILNSYRTKHGTTL